MGKKSKKKSKKPHLKGKASILFDFFKKKKLWFLDDVPPQTSIVHTSMLIWTDIAGRYGESLLLIIVDELSEKLLILGC